jgi:hypothetical protein
VLNCSGMSGNYQWHKWRGCTLGSRYYCWNPTLQRPPFYFRGKPGLNSGHRVSAYHGRILACWAVPTAHW